MAQSPSEDAHLSRQNWPSDGRKLLLSPGMHHSRKKRRTSQPAVSIQTLTSAMRADVRRLYGSTHPRHRQLLLVQDEAHAGCVVERDETVRVYLERLGQHEVAAVGVPFGGV